MCVKGESSKKTHPEQDLKRVREHVVWRSTSLGGSNDNATLSRHAISQCQLCDPVGVTSASVRALFQVFRSKLGIASDAVLSALCTF